MGNFCFEEADGALNKLKTSRGGLSDEEALKRVEIYGKNTIENGKKTSLFGLFFGQFKDFMTLLLIVAAAVSGLIAFISKDKSDLTDVVIILVIILMNAVVGTVQQYRADKAIENLKKLSAGSSKVRRGGKEVVVATDDITVGDIVLLEEGDVVPADCRIISCNGLVCDESALTGESTGAEKSVGRIHGNKVALGEMKNTLFSSTYVLRGNAEAVVTSVGMGTEMGKIAAMLEGGKNSRTPLERSLDKLGKIITAFVLAVTAVIFIMGIAVRQDGLLKNFMTSVAIAVAAIPEGLPAVVTIIMAMGVQKMSKKKVVIRKLKSVETLGSCSVICSDKTGTLTNNKLKVVALRTDGAGQDFKAGNKIYDRLMFCMSACTSLKGGRGNYIGDPTEIALKEYADGEGFIADFEKIAEEPFTSERKMMTVAVKTSSFGGERASYTKGAPDVLLKKCAYVLTKSGKKPMTDADRAAILRDNDEMSENALRVLGFAYAPFGGKIEENGLTFIGMCGMLDGLKEGVAEAVSECRQAGITTVMITGDHARTALAIAKKLNIADDMNEVMTGDELDALPKKGRDAAIERCRVFARVSPKHKNMIVKSLKRRGKVVAMTGDGVNDAPSIKEADIGISMGISGTDVTKSASDMVICDDNFATIVAAVREGRRISSNIRKTILFFISTNLAEVLAVLIASLFFFKFDFLLSTQLLWLNLITDSFPVLALGTEKEDDDVMRRPPERAEAGLFSKSSVAAMLYYGAYITAVTVAVYASALFSSGNAVATTMTFMTISFLELFQAFNIRTDRASAFGKGLFTNKILLVTVAAGVLLNVALCVSPLSSAFGLSALSGAQWAVVFGASLSVIPAGELYKLVLRAVTRKKLRRVRSKIGKRAGAY